MESSRMHLPERRQSRVAPKAILRPGHLGHYPEVQQDRWYPLDVTPAAHSVYVWLLTPHGAVRVQRTDVQIRDYPP
jgi:hypothetical protein